MKTSVATELRTKSHFQVLDGLRGVAAIMVVIFHLFEAYADDNRFKQIVNHGYLAVDFFFLLSGFVVAYAYDDRWGRMGQWEFYKRRLIRLQPMVMAGTLVGAMLFYPQRGPLFPLIASTPLWKVLAIMLIGFTMIPVLPSMDIRGWSETAPLNGPAWSLLYEYVANILYGAGLRKLPIKALAALVFAAAVFLVQLAVFGSRGDLIGGWSLDGRQMHIGLARMLYPFFAGILLMRLDKRIHLRHAFAVSSVLLIAVFCCPRLGGPEHLWANGLYDSLSVLVLFPLIVAAGAGNTVHSAASLRLAKWFGDLSYPLYITHYPLIYVYTAWVVGRKIPPREGALAGALLLATAVGLAYAWLKFYDEPLRRWLTRRFLGRPAESA